MMSSNRVNSCISLSYHHILHREGICDYWLLGQEKDYGILVRWFSSTPNKTTIGLIDEENSCLLELISLDGHQNVVHASISSCFTLLAYNMKSPVDGDDEEAGALYDLHLRDLNSIGKVTTVVTRCQQQVIGRFIYNRKSESKKLLVMIHQKSITLYEALPDDDENWHLRLLEVMVEVFPWAQWDCQNQVLFYIHFRKSNQSCQEETSEANVKAPTLSALQFNEDTPNESVLNTPINLPLLMFDNPSFLYDDDPIPCRVNDDSLNVLVLTSSSGHLCICYHYIFQPVGRGDEVAMDETVHLAYSITVVHAARVIHCTVPCIPWQTASTIRLTFDIHEREGQIVVSVPGMFVHGICMNLCSGHVLCPPVTTSNHSVCVSRPNGPSLFTQRCPSGPPVSIELPVIGHHKLSVPTNLLDLSVIHHLAVHASDLDSAAELMLSVAEDCVSSTLYKLFNELLIGGSYAWVVKMTHADAAALFKLLPLTTIEPSQNCILKFNKYKISVVHEELWNPTVMLLTPHQRLCPFKVDLWSKLWDQVQSIGTSPRFKSSAVYEKLMISLVCYQPEALSRCTTPLSPGVGIFSTFGLYDNSSKIGKTKSLLPFFEVEKCTASKQEHIISVNLRELSVHLVKESSESSMNINAVASRYTAAQLELSKYLCAVVTKSVGVVALYSKGFNLIDSLDEARKRVLLHLLERVMVSAEMVAYPLPPGFHSFITYLAYSTLPFSVFLQYVENNVLQLQIDVVKVIMKGLGSGTEGEQRRLQLAALLPRSRARRLMRNWAAPVALVLAARDHSLAILSGSPRPPAGSQLSRPHPPVMNIFSSPGRLSPFETFLNLLTAKACLNELDFNLLSEATTASIKL